MILNPSMVILDEPVSALDVSIRAQIRNLLSDLQGQLGLTCFIIAHDLATLGHVSARIGIMYLGKIVGLGNTDKIFREPLHPYTIALFSAMPQPEPGRVKVKASLLGEIGSALNIPQGCRFHPRCEHASHECRETEPLLKEMSPFHQVACHKAHIDSAGRAITFKEKLL
jgi:oligopeptide/dipeptide ABC transporter ATP-binding protein